MISPEFWQGRRVFVTGHTGFKGSWLLLWLRSLGAKVAGYALPPDSTPDMFSLLGLHEGIEHHAADIRDFERLKKTIASFQPEIVFHLAAQPLVRRSYDDPLTTYGTNVMGTLHVLEALRLTTSTRVLVNVTTDKCYANKSWVWGYREDDELGGSDPYSNSKACSELVTEAYRNSYWKQEGHRETSPAVATARAGNVIGGGDWSADRLIPDIVRAMTDAREVVIRNPAATRPWQHVLEPLQGYLLLAQHLWSDKDYYQDGWNFGPPAEGTACVEEVLELFFASWGGTPHWRHEVTAEDRARKEATLLQLDSSKAQQRLGWRPLWDLATSVARTAEWYRAHDEGNRKTVEHVTQTQLREYQALLQTMSSRRRPLLSTRGGLGDDEYAREALSLPVSGLNSSL